MLRRSVDSFPAPRFSRLALAVLALFFFIIWRAIPIATQVKSRFSMHHATTGAVYQFFPRIGGVPFGPS